MPFVSISTYTLSMKAFLLSINGVQNYINILFEQIFLRLFFQKKPKESDIPHYAKIAKAFNKHRDRVMLFIDLGITASLVERAGDGVTVQAQ